MSRRNWYLLTNSVVLGWIVLALVATAAHRVVDRPLWLLVHVPLLGAATAAILIWSQHFADTLLRRPAPGGRPGLAVRLGLHTVGAAVVIAGMLASSLPLVLVGAGVVAAAIVAHAAVLVLQSRRALPTRFGPLVRYYIAASLVFVGGIGAGAAMPALVAPAAADRIALTHLLLNAFGWIGLTVLGTLVLLWPTVLHARIPESADAAARHALPMLVGGLLVAAAGPLLGVPALIAIGLAAWLVGAVRLAVEGVREARSMPPATFAGWSLAAAFGWIVVTAATLAVLAVAAPGWAAVREGFLFVLGPLVAGGAVQIVTGALSYLLPVVALGSPAAAKAGAEVLDRGATLRAVLFNGAIALYLLPMPPMVRMLLAAAAAAVVLAFLVLAVRAVVVGRRVRRAEGDRPDRSGRVRLGMPAEPAPRRSRLGAILSAGAVLALCVVGGVAADPAAVGIATAPPAQEVVATGETTRVTVRVEGMRYIPDVIEVPAGDVLEVVFENTGTDVHDLVFANGVRTDRLGPGTRQTVEVGLIGADLDGWCSVAGHRQMGMELVVRVIGATPPADRG